MLKESPTHMYLLQRSPTHIHSLQGESHPYSHTCKVRPPTLAKQLHPHVRKPHPHTHLFVVTLRSFCSTEQSIVKSSIIRHRTSRCKRILSLTLTGKEYWVLLTPTCFSVNLSRSGSSTPSGGAIPSKQMPAKGAWSLTCSSSISSNLMHVHVSLVDLLIMHYWK